LSGGVVKLRYHLDVDPGNTVALLAIFLIPEGQAQGQGGGIPDALAAGPGDGERYLSRPAGSYQLNIQSFSGSWTVGIDEQ
jgi:hypothetical protein